MNIVHKVQTNVQSKNNEKNEKRQKVQLINVQSNFLSQISLPWQQESVGVKFCWQYFMAQPRKPPYTDAKISHISLAEAELQPILSQISLLWQPGRVRNKFEWQC